MNAAPTSSATSRATLRTALNTALHDAMIADDRVFCIGEDIADPMGGSYKITAGLSGQFGLKRVRNTPISETAIVGAAVGAALAGRIPVAEIMYVDFLAVAMDQVVNQAALLSYMSGGRLHVPLVIRCQGGAWRASSAQHSKSLEAWFAHIPGLKMVVPTTPQDGYDLLRWAIDDPGPVLFYEPNLLYGAKGSLEPRYPAEDPTSTVVRRAGRHASIVTWGTTTRMALDAAKQLSETDGIELEVLEVRCLAPLDLSIVKDSVRRTGLAAILHEAWVVGGLGAEIAAQLSEDCMHYLDGPIRRIGADHAPHPFSPVLETAMLPDGERVVSAVRTWFA